MSNESFLRQVKVGNYNILPQEFQSLEIQGYEIVFQEPNNIYVQKKIVIIYIF